MARVLLLRLLLFAAPFAAWFVWREVARRTGRPMGSTPWAPLVAAGALLAALSLFAAGLIHREPDTGVYVPAVVRADGSVIAGHFTPRPALRRKEP